MKNFMLIGVLEEGFVAFGVLISLIPVLLAVALLTLLERKVLGYMQFRKGPNLVGPLGLLQPFADALKLFIKENFKPSSASPFLFFLSPLVFFFLALLIWGVVPVYTSSINMKLSLLFVVTFSSLSVYAMLSAGWSSKSKYSLLGSVRGVAQTISYEVSFGLMLLSMVVLIGSWGFDSFSIIQKGVWIVFPCFPLSMMWYISTLAETNRAPFDLTEGESELVSGYNVEYSGAPFALFFIGEYANIMIMNLLSVIMFFGGCSPFILSMPGMLVLVIKTLSFVFSFLWVRASFPRIRYDQLMMVMWKGILPLSISLFSFYYVLIMKFNLFACYY